jgi:hypothetical protein
MLLLEGVVYTTMCYPDLSLCRRPIPAAAPGIGVMRIGELAVVTHTQGGGGCVLLYHRCMFCSVRIASFIPMV